MRRPALAVLALLGAAAACERGALDPERPAAPAVLEIVSGDAQAGPAGTAAPDSIGVRVLDAAGRPRSGVVIRWQPESGATVSPAVSVTNLAGHAYARLTFGQQAGQGSVLATAADLDPARLGFTVRAGPPSAFSGREGHAQSAAVGTVLPRSLAATLVDAFGNPVPATGVTWKVLTGGGTVTPVQLPDTATRAMAHWQLGTGAGPQRAAVYHPGGDSLIFNATALPGPLVTLTLSAPAPSLEVGMLMRVTPAGADAYGNAVAVPAASVAWSVSNANRAAVDPTGLVRGLARGAIEVRGTAGGVAAAVPLNVTLSTVASVDVTPTTLLMPVGDSAVFTAVPRNAAGAALPDRWIDWSVTGSAGQLAHAPGASGATFRATAEGGVSVTATVAGRTGSAAVDVRQPQHARFTTLAAGAVLNCGVSADSRTWCWGTLDSLSVVADPPGGITSPAPVEGAPVFTSLAIGTFHACGLAAQGAAFCWGDGSSGRLGNGGTTSSSVPVAVAGNRRFNRLAIGHDHACGLTPQGAAFCWGDNERGQLGDGTTTDALVPVRVAVPTLIAIAAGYQYTCGITDDGVALCWGFNDLGQLGNGTGADTPTPTPVATDERFRALAGGGAHVCAASLAGAVSCWGNNRFGQLGDGTTTDSNRPVRALNPAPLVSLSSRGVHSCGLTADGAAFCWGWGEAGQIGNGEKRADQPPVAVAPAMRFKSIQAGALHTCATTLADAAWCWGDSTFGQVGDLRREERLLPVPVLTYR